MKSLPFSKEKIESIINQYPTPFHIYDEKGFKDNAKKFLAAFSWNKGFKEYFAVKACPNPHLIKTLKEIGFGTDCSSIAELVISEKVGITGENIMFTSNETPKYEYERALELGAVVNLDDISHIEYLEKEFGKLPELISFRYNPGSQKTGNAIIGTPLEAKYGLTHEQMIDAYKMAKDKGVKRFGIHTMVASNELHESYFAETANILFSLVVEIKEKVGIDIEFANLGGGLGIPYKPEDKAINYETLSNGIKRQYDQILVPAGLGNLKLYMEAGRIIMGPYGYLVTTALHFKNTYKQYVGLDACMANLMRPALYGSYHHITVMGKENAEASEIYDVVGSLCENNDKFAINRKLPKIDRGDIVVIHDAGAHGHSMGFNYNGKLRSAELLLQENGDVKQIRRAETLDDYFATLEF